MPSAAPFKDDVAVIVVHFNEGAMSVRRRVLAEGRVR